MWSDGTRNLKERRMSRFFMLIALVVFVLSGCGTKVGIPKEPLAFECDRYDGASLTIDGAEISDRVRVKAESVLPVTGRMTRRAEQTYQYTTDGVAFQFRCDNSSVTKSLEQDWQLIRYVSDPKGHTDYAVETNGVITFNGSLRVPKRYGDYELYMSVVELVRNDAGTAIKAVRLPVKRLIITVE